MVTSIARLASVARALSLSGILGGNLAALALLRRPREAMAYIQYGLFGWRMLQRQGLVQQPFHEVFPTSGRESIDVLPETTYLKSWDATYTKDVVFLALLAKVLRPRTVFEIGTLQGTTALLFAANAPDEATVFTLDLPPDWSGSPALATTVVDSWHIAGRAKPTDYVYLRDPDGRKVKQLFGDSSTFDFSPFHRAVDLFFIDGAHSYEYVRSDTINALACVRSGGVLAWHDYGRWGVNGVSRWLHELARSGQNVFRLPGSSLAILKVD